MNSENPLKSVFFITLPDGYKLGKNAFPIDTTIPLPVQIEDGDAKNFDINSLSWEMIVAGILVIFAHDRQNPNILYYRSLVNSLKPDIKKEMSEAAILKAKNGDWDIAEEIFTALNGLDPDDNVLVLNSAIFFDQRAENYAKSALTEDAEAYDNLALEYYNRAMSAEPSMPDAFFNAGFFFLKQHNFARGKECFETYLSLVTDNSDNKMSENEKFKRDRAQEVLHDITTRNLDDNLFRDAYKAIHDGNIEDGLEKIKTFLQKNPKVWNAWFMLGWALRLLSRYEDAKNAFLESVKRGAKNADTYNELAICCMELNQFEEARQNLLHALSLENENTKIISNFGFLELKLGNIDEAKRYFETVLALDGDDVIAKTALENLAL